MFVDVVVCVVINIYFGKINNHISRHWEKKFVQKLLFKMRNEIFNKGLLELIFNIENLITNVGHNTS